ncbi:MAG: hypothetical protein RIS47_2042 [Bacteroidota bacterium]|jgi:hypothetical protein
MASLTNRKKIRNWKRQVRKIDKWYADCLVPDVAQLDEWRDEYAKIWIDPWFRLQKRNPPLWYFRLILRRFNDLYAAWKIALDTYGIPYDLQLWLFERNYVESELVAAPVSDANDLKHTYFEPCVEERRFPTEKFRTQGFEPADFDWNLKLATVCFFEFSDELSEGEMASLVSKGFGVKYIHMGLACQERVFWKARDFVWIGRKLGQC